MDILGFNIGGSASGLIGSLISFLKIMALMAVFGGGAMFALYLLKYKYFVTVRMLAGGREIIIRDKARKIKSKKGVERLKLRKLNEQLPLPPDEVCNTTDRGKVYLDVYRTQAGQYIWAKSKGLAEGVKIPNNRDTSDFEAMNTADRDFYASEWEESERYNKNKIWQNLPQVAGLAVLLVLFVLVVVYWEDIAQPAKEIQKESVKILDKADDILEKAVQIQAAQSGQQVIDTDEEIPSEKNKPND